VRYPRVLFLTPTSPGRYFGGVRPPVGIGYVEEFVAAHGVATAAIDMNVDFAERDVFDLVEAFQPDLIGVTMMTYQYMTTYALIRKLRQRFSRVRVVVGGPHVSALEGTVLQQCPEVDYAVAGEGEIPLRDLCL